MNKKEKETNRLADEFDTIQSGGNEFDITSHLATPGDLPDLGQIEFYDYDADLKIVIQKGMDVLESLVDLYLGDFPNLKNHPYIQNKLKEDAMVYAETLFLSKMTRKNFLAQLRQIDNGDNNARMHEIVNQTIREIRENSKFASTQRNDLEKFYKEFRNDLNEVVDSNKTAGVDSGSSSGGEEIIDNKKMNDLIHNAIKNRKD